MAVVHCHSCGGKGVLENSQHEFKRCPICSGTGIVSESVITGAPVDRNETVKSPSVFPGVVAVEDEIKKGGNGVH